MSDSHRAFAFALVLPFLGAAESPASAYSYESAVATGCHERITMGALRKLRTELATAKAAAPDANDRALIDDVPFKLDPDMVDTASASLVIGVRDNDLHGNGPTDVSRLATVHGNPENQKEHCLRDLNDDEPGGSERALDACKTFIREKLLEALNGLDANGAPDPAHRVDIDVHLALRGRVTASLPLYWVRTGQAVHALQDSFTHTFRSPDRMRVRTVLNWVDYVGGTQVESRDGPLHRNGLDQCDDLDDLQKLNIDVASAASLELMSATLDPSRTREEKVAAIDAVLVKYLSFESGCSAANGWCDAPEQKYQIASGCGCSVPGGQSGGTLAAGAAMFGVLLLGARRRRRRLMKGLLATVFLASALPSPARAQTAPTGSHQTSETPSSPVSGTTPPTSGGTTTDPHSGTVVAKDEDKPPPGVPTLPEVKAERTEKKHRSLFGLYAAGSGSVTNPGLSGQLGVRLHLSERWTVGLDGELNGWYAVQTGRFRTGAFNAYVTGIFRYPLRFQQINLRSTANLGTSTMLIDLYGAPSGTTGIFLGLTPIGLEWKVSSSFYVIWDPLGIALPVPQLKGAPFAYPQYRTALGIEIAL